MPTNTAVMEKTTTGATTKPAKQADAVKTAVVTINPPTKAQKVAKERTAVYSTPVSKDAKEFILNESSRTGLSQKGIIDAAITALKAGKQLPNALPVKL